jgi:hypothetical protein
MGGRSYLIPGSDGEVIPATAGPLGLNGVAGGGRVEVRVVLDVTGGDRHMLTWLRNAVRVEGGGDVQVALGQAGR